MEIVVHGLKKSFNVGDREFAFNLDLPPLSLELGKVTYLMGPNGSGKSVLIRLLSGVLKTSGDPISMQIGTERQRSNAVPVVVVRQRTEDNLCLDLTVEENLVLRMKANSFLQRVFPKRYLIQQVKKTLIPQPVLLNKLKQRCSELSGGQKQILAFLAAISRQSKILCLDEFLTASDYYTSQFLRSRAVEYAHSNQACVLIASHNFDLALEDASRIIIIRNGKLVAEVTRDSAQWSKEELVRLVHM